MQIYPPATAPVTVNRLVSPRRKVTLYGEAAETLSYRYAAEIAGQEIVTFLCGDNRFDPYAVARFAKARKQDRRQTLARIRVARGFTGYQFDEMIKRLGPEQVAGPIIVTGVCSAFLDEDIPHNDAARLFYRALSRLVELAERGAAILLTQTQQILDGRRAYFLRDLFRASDFIFRLDGEGSYELEVTPIGLATIGPAPALPA